MYGNDDSPPEIEVIPPCFHARIATNVDAFQAFSVPVFTLLLDSEDRCRGQSGTCPSIGIMRNFLIMRTTLGEAFQGHCYSSIVMAYCLVHYPRVS